MPGRTSSISILATLAFAPLAILGCSQDTPDPTETVRLAVMAGADHGGRPFSTDMTQEVTVSPPHTGDPDGTGSALITLNHGKGEVCWEVTVSDITLPGTASHIHQADPFVRGPIVVGLVPPDASGASTGCVSGVSRDLINSILHTPEAYYVNVHTSDYPAGAVRGQLPSH